MADAIKGKILADGTIKFTTDEVSPENHVNAEGILKFVGQQLGGKTTREARGDVSHHHAHTHSHGGVTHSH